MFDEFMGLPVHPLLVHAAVVFVPLLCLLAVVYAVVPRLRAMTGWAAAALAVAAPFAAWFATLSGKELEAKLLAQGMSGPIVQQINDHQGFGDRTLYFSIALGVVTLLMVFLYGTRSGRARTIPSAASIVLAVITIGLAAGTGYYAFKTGDSGARAVWGG